MGSTIRRQAEKSNFVLIPNTLANDSRLSLEALGLLTHLLHRPADWRINGEQLRQQWGIGRDKLQGILKELREVGYARLTKIHNPATGRVIGSEYVISSCPNLASDVREPESPVPGAESLKNRQSDIPAAGKAGCNTNTENLTKTDSPLNPLAEAPAEIGPAFDQFERAWQFDVTEALDPARKAFSSLSAEDRRSSIKYAPAYRAECRRAIRQSSKPHTWLRQKGWEVLAKAAVGVTQPSNLRPVFIPKGSAAFQAWDTHLRSEGKRAVAVRSETKRQEGCWQASQYPPG
jgi:hypothetical protein